MQRENKMLELGMISISCLNVYQECKEWDSEEDDDREKFSSQRNHLFPDGFQLILTFNFSALICIEHIISVSMQCQDAVFYQFMRQDSIPYCDIVVRN